MKVNRTVWNMVRDAVGTLSREIGVDVYEMSDCATGKPSPYTWGVNWSAMGLQDVKETVAYIVKMTAAANLAAFLNGCEFMVDGMEKIDITDENRDFLRCQKEIMTAAIRQHNEIDLALAIAQIRKEVA